MSDDKDETPKGSTQLVPPYIESGMRDPFVGRLLRDWAVLTPALVPLFVAVMWAFLTGDYSLIKYAIALGAIIGAVCHTIAQEIDWEFFSPWDDITGYWRKAKLIATRYYPLSREEFVTNAEHGYGRILDSGYAEMQDGRMVAFVRAPSRNTSRQTSSETNQMVLSLTSAIRRHFPESVTVWQTTFDSDPEEYLEQWRNQRHSETFAGRPWRYTRAFLDDLFSREHREENEWNPRDRETFFVVDVKPHEVRRRSTAETSEEGLSDTVKNGITGDSEITDYQRHRMTDRLDKRVRKVTQVARQIAETSVDEREIGLLGPGEHAMLVAKYWRGVEPDFEGLSEADDVALSVWPDVDDYAATSTDDTRQSPYKPVEVDGEAGEPLATASVTQTAVEADGGEIQAETMTKDTTAGPEIPEPGSAKETYAALREGLFGPHSVGSPGEFEVNDSQIADYLAPSEFDTDGAYITVGDQLCKSFWLAGWATEPESNLLQEIQNMRGVDYDICIRGTSPNRRAMISWLKEKIEDSGASISEHNKSGDIEASVMSDEISYYIDMYKALKKKSARPWRINVYLTVRVGQKRAYDYVESESRQGSEMDVDVAKRRALDDACDKIIEAIEDDPMSMHPITSTKRADLLFESAFPASRDTYNEDTDKEKTSPTLSGTFAATYPFATATVQEPTGVLFGRDVTNGQKIVGDQFARDGASHRLTGGRSGSGKTFLVGDQAAQWWLGGEPVDSETYASSNADADSDGDLT